MAALKYFSFWAEIQKMNKINPQPNNTLLSKEGMVRMTSSGGCEKVAAAMYPLQRGRMNKIKRYACYMAIFLLANVGLNGGSSFAARMSDVKNTKHNLSISGPGTVKAVEYSGVTTKQSQICVFCHTPHGATLGVNPLWNKRISSAVYSTYTSSSLDADAILKSDPLYADYTDLQINNLLKQPGGSSKLCLSCHDGTLAVGNVNVMWGLGTSTSQWSMAMLGTSGADTKLMGGKMPYGGFGTVSGVVSGVSSGYTRNLGIDLTNDHPISVNYTKALADRDGELRSVVGPGVGVPAANLQKSVEVGGYTLGQIVGIRGSGYRPLAPLEPTGSAGVGQIQCAACHDPHLRETDTSVGNQKFLRLNRFQEGPPTGSYNSFNDIGCVACHDKDFNTTSPATGAGTWSYSVHANPLVATPPQTYKADAATMREFPTSADRQVTNDNLPMWQASCLNCHDTHTVQGARQLLREGTDNIPVTTTPPTPKAGGKSALEETCYQCHTSPSESVIGNDQAENPAQDIKYDYVGMNKKRMPITLADQQGNANGGSPAAEVHSIGGNFPSGGTPAESVDCASLTNKCGSDFVESREKMGAGGNLGNRHAECTDCHNPHRVVKFQNFQGKQGFLGDLSATPDAKGTHKHPADSNESADYNTYTHTNIASGSLRGTFGVEPDFSSSSADFHTGMPTYTVKRGDPDSVLGVADCAGDNKATCDDPGITFVTREYQICLKCHSDYGYSDNNGVDNESNRPALGGDGLTSAGTNGLNKYTNQAREFQAPSAHRAEPKATDSGAAVPTYADGVTQTNYRSWHPVLDSTGRNTSVRGNMDADAFTLPWSNDVGNQTMYCSDCHGANVSSTNSVIPENALSYRKTWGPHGSDNDFILKGQWSDATGPGQTSGICFKCHDFDSYAGNTGGAGKRTGFWLSDVGKDGHQRHVDLIGNGGSRCTMCHIAVPHGWKNKGLLVNLNDVGPEAECSPGVSCTAGTEVVVLATSGVGFNAPPYYLNALLKVINFKPSGNWTEADCGSPAGSTSGNGQNGVNWMKTSDENCATPP
jgi:hypothetical protein